MVGRRVESELARPKRLELPRPDRQREFDSNLSQHDRLIATAFEAFAPEHPLDQGMHEELGDVADDARVSGFASHSYAPNTLSITGPNIEQPTQLRKFLPGVVTLRPSGWNAS
jgi:hypothetical protein